MSDSVTYVLLDVLHFFSCCVCGWMSVLDSFTVSVNPNETENCAGDTVLGLRSRPLFLLKFSFNLPYILDSCIKDLIAPGSL